MGFDLLKTLKPILNLMPTVPKPGRKVPIKKRLVYTISALALYLVCTLLPLYGVKKIPGQDPMYHLRILTASSKYTLMELGISPIISSGMILQFLSGFGLIRRDPTDPGSMALFDAAQKLAGLVMTAFQAISNLLSGGYGNVQEIGIVGGALLVGQLLVAGVVVILLDELMDNYGVGSGTSLFICTNICQQIMWRLFSFQKNSFGHGVEFEGAIIALFHLLIVRKDKLRALREAVFRRHLPNIGGVVSTVIIFVAVIFFEHIKINIGLQTTMNRQQPQPFEIRLFYTSNTPIIVQSTIISQICSFSKIIANHWPDSLITKIIGQWESPESGLSADYAVPVGGLAYYLQAPDSIDQTLKDPFHTFVYLAISLSTAGLIAYYYINVGGQSPADIARQLKSQHLTIVGHRDDHKVVERVLNKYIPTTAALGGILTALLAFVADFLGAYGSGTGIILAVSIIYQFWEELSKEMVDLNQYLF